MIEKDFYVAKLAKDLPLSIDTIRSVLNIKNAQSTYRPQYERPVFQEVKPEPVKTKKNNYSYALIRSLSKPLMINAFIQRMDEINFIDRQLIEIGKYLVSVQNGSVKEKPSKELALKVNEILKEDSYAAETVEEFDDLVKKVNNEFYDHYINEYKVKLKNETDDEKKNEYLLAIVELKHKKGN